MRLALITQITLKVKFTISLRSVYYYRLRHHLSSFYKIVFIQI